MKKKAVHKTKVLTPTERDRMKRLQAELDSEKDEIIASGRALLDAHDAMNCRVAGGSAICKGKAKPQPERLADAHWHRQSSTQPAVQ